MIFRKPKSPAFIFLVVALSVAASGELPRLQVSQRGDVDAQFAAELEKAINMELKLSEKYWEFGDQTDSAIDNPRAGSVLIQINDASWKTKKARSLAYLFNRYFKYFRMEITVVHFYGREERKIKSLVAEDGGKPQAQFFSNDCYDGDIFPDQSEKIDTERNVCRKLAKKIVKLISDK